MKCAFCEIPEMKERKIVENKLAWAFPSNTPITTGHTLISPKRCVAIFEDLTNDEIKAIFNLASIIKKALKKTYNAQGFNVAWNEKLIAGQTVPYFHLHIIARKKNDSGVHEYDPRKLIYRPGNRKNTPESKLRMVASEIQQNIC